MYEQRDIVLIPFPYSDLTGSKQRPALILSNSRLNRTEDRICCLVTRAAPKDGVPILKDALASGSLRFRSWVKPHRIFTVNQRIIRKRLCRVTPAFHAKIVGVLNEYLKPESGEA